MKPETLILANILDKKIKAVEEKIKDLKEKNIQYVEFVEMFSDDNISLDVDNEDDAGDIQALINSYPIYLFNVAGI